MVSIVFHFFHCFRLRPSRFPLLRPWQIDAWGTCGAKYRRPRRKISAPAAQQTSVPAAQKNISAYGALNKRHRRNNSVPAAQNNMYGAQEKPAPAVQKRCLRRDENGAYSSENMAHAVLVIDVFPIRSCMLLCAHLRPISLYIFPYFSIYFHFIPLLLSFEKPCH